MNAMQDLHDVRMILPRQVTFYLKPGGNKDLPPFYSPLQ